MAQAGFWAIESQRIRFGKDGCWYANDEPIANQRIADLFSRHVQRADDGSFWLISGDERAPIEVEDTPFVVTRVDGRPEQGFTIRLNDHTVEDLDPASLRIAPSNVLYCDVKSGRYAARFLRPAQSELLSHARTDGDGYALPLPGGGAQPLAAASGAANRAHGEPEAAKP